MEEFMQKLCSQHDPIALRQEFNALQQKYDALNAKFNLNQPKIEAAQAAAMQSILTRQAMGMGAVFRK